MYKNKKNSFEIILRNECNIKSRQWWLKNLVEIKKDLEKRLKNKNLNKLIKSCGLSVLITNNKEIKDLNKKFRKKNKPTDVLSFYYLKSEQLKNKYLGDIVISLEYVTNNCKKTKLLIEVELINLLIHGYLHLLGFDHVSLKEEKIMFNYQSKILKNVRKNQK